MSDSVEGSPVVEGIVEEVAAPAEEVAAPEAEVEAKPEVETKPEAQTEEDRRFAAKFAALSRKEKALKQQEREIKARLAALEAQTKPKEEPKAPETPLEMRLRRDPFKTLEELGIGYETLTRRALNEGKMTPEEQVLLLREEMKQEFESKYGKEIEELKKSRQEELEAAKKEKEAQQVQAYKSQIADFVKTNAEKYELLASESDASDLIYETILDQYTATLEANGEVTEEDILSVEEAAERIENALLDEAKKRINLSKIKKLLEPSQSSKEEPGKGKKVSPTLSNEQSQVQGAKKQFLSDEESKAEAAKLIRWVE